MNETQEKLLRERGVIILPEDIRHETYVDTLSLLLLAESEWTAEIKLYCAGSGGSAPDAIAIVDLIQARGNVTGYLAGQAQSCHTTIWAGCNKRIVYPYASIGVHGLRWSSLSEQDIRSLNNRNNELVSGERKISNIMASACSAEFDETFWRGVIQETGSDGIRIFDAVDCIKMGMATF